MKVLTVKSVIWSLTGTLGLILFYFLTMRVLAGSWETAFSQFEKLWYFMIPLSLGFGIQLGLYKTLKERMKKNSTTKIMATNTTASTVGMVACCAHHAADVLPILGLSAVSIFLVKFQTPILLLGIVSNILGIIYLIRMTNSDLDTSEVAGPSKVEGHDSLQGEPSG